MQHHLAGTAENVGTPAAAAAAHLGGSEAGDAGAHDHDVKYPAVVPSLCSTARAGCLRGGCLSSPHAQAAPLPGSLTLLGGLPSGLDGPVQGRCVREHTVRGCCAPGGLGCGRRHPQQ